MSAGPRPDRVTYAIDKDVTDRQEASRACNAVLDMLADKLAPAHIDAFSDYPDL